MKRLYVGVVNVSQGSAITNEIFVDWGDDARATEAEWLLRTREKHPDKAIIGSSCHDITEIAGRGA